jgi:hypothetical protein
VIDPIIDVANCDVLIGIFWKRFGTPTMDGQSGTEHEFRTAYEAWKKHGRPKIMVYFNQRPYTAKSKEETDEWGRVLKFKDEFPKEGLWWSYTGTAAFEKLLRTHLTRVVLTEAPQDQSSLLTGPKGTRPPSSWIKGSSPPLPAVFIGREGSLLELKRRLGIILTDRPRGPLQVIAAVRGWPGVGKSALAAVLAHDEEVKKAFPDGVLWTSLGERPDVLSSILRWGAALDENQKWGELPTLKETTVRLAAVLRDKRMLLLVDDVWRTEHGEVFRQTSGKGCALIFTTRVRVVAEALAPTADSIYSLPVLAEEDALELLRTLAPAVVDRYPDDCREVVHDLECLPLALQVAGRMLQAEAGKGWDPKRLLSELRAGVRILGQRAPADRIDLETQTIPTVAVLLRKSTELLDVKTRECFAYLGAFAPKPATVDLAAMKAVWREENPQPIAESLIDHGLLEPTTSGRFQMHALLVALAKSLLQE